MLFFSLWPDGGGHASYDAGLAALQRERATRDELRSVVELSFDAARHHALDSADHLGDVPLRVHARYQREEILAALDYASLQRKPNSFREGVLYVPDLNVDAFFVTLKKSEADYSPTTMYRDYPISPDAVPLGVAVHDVDRLGDRSALPVRIQHGAAVRPRGAEGRVRHVAVPLPRTCALRHRTPASGRSRSPGSSITRCRRTSSPRRPSPRADPATAGHCPSQGGTQAMSSGTLRL